jgi:hypothetical protein
MAAGDIVGGYGVCRRSTVYQSLGVGSGEQMWRACNELRVHVGLKVPK